MFRCKGMLLRFPLMYALLGLAAAAAPGYEVFPFFCWFLFPVTPNTVTRYQLVWSQSDTERPARRVPIAARANEQRLMDFDVAIQNLGLAVSAGDAERVTRWRRLIELNFLASPCVYHVQQVTYDPLVRWRAGEASAETNVAQFRCESLRGVP